MQQLRPVRSRFDFKVIKDRRLTAMGETHNPNLVTGT
jgi:hypothetical protein